MRDGRQPVEVHRGESDEIGPGPPGRLSALTVFHSKSVLYGAFVWARRALNSPKRRFLARKVRVELAGERVQLRAGDRVAFGSAPTHSVTAQLCVVPPSPGRHCHFGRTCQQ